MTEIHFDHDHFSSHTLGFDGIDRKIIGACGDQAQHSGIEQPHAPTDLHVLPVVTDEECIFLVHSWVETGGSEFPGVLQSMTASFSMIVVGENAYLHNSDTGNRYRLSTREALVINNIAHQAVLHALFCKE